MFNPKTYTSYKLLLLVCIALLMANSSLYSSPATYGLQADFTRNNTQVDVGEVANNVFRLKNFTGKPVRFHLNYSVPNGWEILGKTDKEFEMDVNDSIFLPIRVIPDKLVKGGTSYIITVVMISDKSVQFAAQNWYVSVPTKSNWSAHLPFKHQFFTSSKDSSGFEVHLRNDGNADEEIRLTLIPDRKLEVLRKSDGGSSPLMFTIPLATGADTTLVFPVIRNPLLNSGKGRDGDLKTAPLKETYSIQVLAKSISNTGAWSGTVQFTKAGNIGRSNDFNHSAIPLTLEANVYDVLSTGTTMSLDAYGNTTLSGNRLLNYRFQTVFISNYFNQNSFLGNNNYIGYFDNKASIELGEVNGWGRSLLTGRGLKGSYHLGLNTFGAMMTRAPGFFSGIQSEGYGFYHNLKLKKTNWSNYYSHNATTNFGLSSDVINTFLTTKLNQMNQISVGGGYSTDHYFGNTQTGYGYDFNYSGTLKKFNLTLGNSYGTPDYVLARGVHMLTSRTTWSSNSRNNFAFSTQNFSQLPAYFMNGVLVLGNYVRSDRYEFRWGINSLSSTVAIKPAYQWDANRALRVATRLLGVEYNAKNLSSVRFSAMGSMGYAKAVDFSIPDFFVSRISTYVRWEKMYISLRYTYGPVQLAEQVRFINDRINPQTMYLVSSYDYWLRGDKVLISTTGNLLYETYFQKFNFRLRPEIFYYAKSGLRFSFYASFFTSSQGANPMVDELTGKQFDKISDTEMNMGFGVRKQFGIPIPGKKFVTVHAIIFKDLNGNHKKDANEEGVENMLVNISTKNIFNASDDSVTVDNVNGEDFITDSRGEIIYENIPSGIYSFKCTSLMPNGEWFDAGDHEFKIDAKQTIYIPLTRGVRINGSVLIERDKYSGQESDVDLSRIRVTALDSSGKTYSALTDMKGAFVLNVPAGQYTLSINEAALGDNFMFIQNRINLDLTKNFENFSITFNAMEKKRKIEIKKFDNINIQEKK